MKAWIFAVVLSGVLITGGVADARRGAVRANTHNGMRGKITAVGSAGFTMTVGKSRDPQTYLVRINTGTAIKGIKTFDSTLVGDMAIVVGGASGNVITATTVTIHVAHHHTKK
jgi:hypothetical protein